MRLIKKFVCLTLSVAMLSSNVQVKVHAASNATAKTYGFDVDTDAYTGVGLCRDLKTTVYSVNGNIVGTATVTMLFTKQKKQPFKGTNLNVAMYYITVSPKEYTGYNFFGNKMTYQGKSEWFQITSKLPNKNQSLIYTSPENVAKSTSYTVGANISGSEKGFSGGVSANTTITKDRIVITNKSDPDTRQYKMVYDYKRTVNAMNSKNDYLKNLTYQRGMIAYYTDGKSFNFPLTMNAHFGYFWGIYSYDDEYKNSKTWQIAIN